MFLLFFFFIKRKHLIFSYMVIQLRTLENDNLDLKISVKELQISVLNMIKSLHGDFGAGAIKTCFKGKNNLFYCPLY